MSPELRTLIYGTIAGVISAILIYGGKLAFDKFGSRHEAPLDRGQKITALADAMVDVSTQAVAGIRAELDQKSRQLDAARSELDVARTKIDESRVALDERSQQLDAARAELSSTKRMMEDRERDHEAGMGRMRRRIAQLVQVLTDNNIEVPDEVGDHDPAGAR